MVDAIKPFLTGNARVLGYGGREWYENLARFAASNPFGVKISSLDRDVARQGQLWNQAVAKYGSEAAARKWVAPPGRSNHNKGQAADLQYASADARKWAHENAPKFGLAFPLGNENWHVEPAGVRNMGVPPKAQGPAPQAPTEGAPTDGTTPVPQMAQMGPTPQMGQMPQMPQGGGGPLADLLAQFAQPAKRAGQAQPEVQEMRVDDTPAMLARLAGLSV